MNRIISSLGLGALLAMSAAAGAANRESHPGSQGRSRALLRRNAASHRVSMTTAMTTAMTGVTTTATMAVMIITTIVPAVATKRRSVIGAGGLSHREAM